jgi:hypothetical protein
MINYKRMTNKHVALIDHVGRNIIGKLVGETHSTITIENPVILHVQPQQSGQLEVQTFPAFFFEFIDKAHRSDNAWTYTKSSIVTSNVVLDDRILSQYEKINTPPEEAKQTNAKVISIDDI